MIFCFAYPAEHNLFFQASIDLEPAQQRLLPARFIDTSSIIHAAAQKHRVPEAFVKSIVAAESNFHPEAISAKGAIGLMQLMPETAKDFGADPTIPEENVDAGTRYLGSLLARYQKYRNGMSRAIAAYNAGPGIVDRYRGVPPYPETRGYVTRVLGFLKKYQRGDRG
jgi:soluble lytic murein transglycosylase-like protein